MFIAPSYNAIITTPIKINLALHVVGQRHDGYHLLDSLVYFSFQGDNLHYYASEKENSFSLRGSYAKGLSNGSVNLVERARDLLAQTFPSNAHFCHLELEKKLPVASGIGGGSGDAAGAFELLRRNWDIECSDSEWMKLALSLGADVPMCVSALRHHRPLRVTGIGEQLEILDNACSLPLVLINHGQEIPTPEIFRRLTKKTGSSLDFDNSALQTLPTLLAALENTRNDLYEPALAFAPELANVLSVLQKSGALFSRMSGSGATCFGIYENKQMADIAAANIKAQKPHWFVKSVETIGCNNN